MTCESTGKYCYDSKAMAITVLEKKRKKPRSHRYNESKTFSNFKTKEVTAYKCCYCGKWHLAGAPKK